MARSGRRRPANPAPRGALVVGGGPRAQTPPRLPPAAGCPLLTTTGLSGLVQLQELEELELTNCPGATPELFKYFSQHLPRCLVIE